MPTYEPSLTSASVALETPNTVTLSVRLIFTSPSLSDFTDRMRPLKFSTVPETRTVGSGCAQTDVAAMAKTAATEMNRTTMAIITSRELFHGPHTCFLSRRYCPAAFQNRRQ